MTVEAAVSVLELEQGQLKGNGGIGRLADGNSALRPGSPGPSDLAWGYQRKPTDEK